MGTAEADWFDDVAFWRMFLKRLSCGTDAAHDASVIRDFSRHMNIAPWRIVANLKACGYGPGIHVWH